MKTVLLAIALLMGSSAYAAEMFTMPKGMNQMYLIESAELTDVKMYMPKCPPNARCMPSRAAMITVPLNGCVDRLGPVAVVSSRKGEKVILTMTAYGLVNPDSARVRCIARPMARVQVVVGPGVTKENVEIRMPSYMVEEI